MKVRKEHIVFKIITLLLAVTLVVPSLVKFGHALENHKHEVCDVPQKLHFHDYEIDCEFYKFKLNKNQYFEIYIFEESSSLLIDSEIDDKDYFFYKKHLSLSKNLRGPPSLA